MFRTLIIVLIICGTTWAGNILSENSIVSISEPAIDSSTETLRMPMDIFINDPSTGIEKKQGSVDLYQNGVIFTDMMEIFLTDHCRDRLLIAATHQINIPNYKIIDLKTMTIDSLCLDSIKSTFGKISITPDCKYILVFGEDYKSKADRWDDQNVLYTCSFDAESYKPIATLRGLNGSETSFPPGYFLQKGDSAFFITNPLQLWGKRDIIKISLPNLNVIDTIHLGALIKDNDFWVPFDIKDTLALIFCKSSKDNAKLHSFKLINTKTKNILSELLIQAGQNYGVARLSNDGHRIGLQGNDGIVRIFNYAFEPVFGLSNCGGRALALAVFNNQNLIIERADDPGYLYKYDLMTGSLMDKIQINKVQQ